MPIALNAVAVNREPINRLGDQMSARIGVPILIVVGSEDIENDAHFGDVCPFQALEFLTLFGDELCQVVVEEYKSISWGTNVGQLIVSRCAHQLLGVS